VWVFVNGTLAIDLGGIHTPVGGTITIDSSNATSFGLISEHDPRTLLRAPLWAHD